MAELKGSQTHDNLLAVFATEAQAQVRFSYFAQIAEIEGYHHVADTLRELAEAEVLYAHGHLDYLRQVADPATGLPLGETERNLQAALMSDAIGQRETYPALARTAHAEGFPDIASWFETLAKAKRSHAQRLRDALDGKSPASEAP